MNGSLLKKVALDNIAGGVANELFEREIDRVTENINDQNTSATAKRKIILEFEFTPDADRREVSVLVSAKSKTVPVRPMKNTVYCGKIDGRPQMLGHDPDQMELDIHSEEVPELRARMPYKED